MLRIDRADGIYLRNFTVEQGAFNDIDLVEVDGFRVSKVVARYAQNYGVLSFTATHGLYDHDVAYGNGDSGLYPGSTMKGCSTDGGIDPDTDVYGTCEATRAAATPRSRSATRSATATRWATRARRATRPTCTTTSSTTTPPA